MTITMDDPPITYADLAALPEDDTVTSTEHLCGDCGTPVPISKGGRQFSKCLSCRRDARARGPAERESSNGTRRGTTWEGPLASQLTDLIDGIGMAVSIFEPIDGSIIRGGAERLGNSLIGPARTNRKVRTVLENMVTGGAWAGVVMAVAAIALPILSHHNIIPTLVPPRPAPTDKANAGHISV